MWVTEGGGARTHQQAHPNKQQKGGVGAIEAAHGPIREIQCGSGRRAMLPYPAQCTPSATSHVMPSAVFRKRP
ncbi:MAG: hypothetical protein CM15mP18_0650 [Methanobacteriota archaeon]|nr:MAG: hypothetical protein CM15mP18_0650 [Euryarchaeota archaeon]